MALVLLNTLECVLDARFRSFEHLCEAAGIDIRAPVTPTLGLLRRDAARMAWIVVAMVAGDPAALLRL